MQNANSRLARLCFTTLVATTIFAFAGRVLAQQAIVDSNPAPVQPESSSRTVIGGSKLPAPAADTWEQASRTRYPHGAEIETVSEPGRRQKCNVASFDAERIVCKRAFGQTQTFARENVAAVFERQSQSARWPGVLVPALLAGGNVYLAVLLAGLGTIGAVAIVPVGAFAVMWIAVSAMSVVDQEYAPREIYRRAAQVNAAVAVHA